MYSWHSVPIVLQRPGNGPPLVGIPSAVPRMALSPAVPTHVAEHLHRAPSVAGARPLMGHRGPRTVVVGHHDTVLVGCAYGAGRTTRYGDRVHPAGVVRVTEGLAGPHQSSRGPHQGLLGATGHYGVGVARTSTVPTGGAAGSPRAALN